MMRKTPTLAVKISDIPRKPLVIFSDLDGSLLDHDTYSWAAAQAALDAVKENHVPLILVSSKTLAELEDLRTQLDLRHPLVGENGAAIAVPKGYFKQAVTESIELPGRSEIQTVYADLKRTHNYQCQAFFELGIAGIVEHTGLELQAAEKANQRQFSEPILWQDTEANAQHFMDAAALHGLRCTRGGRFLHLMAATDKQDAVRLLTKAYAAEFPSLLLTSMSLGDGPNDLGMLASTDIAVIIPGKHSHPMSLSTTGEVIHPNLSGPAGWNEAVLKVLEKFDARQ